MTKFKLSPSKAHRYLQCTASLLHDTEFVETEWTIRGTNLHTLAEMIIKNQDGIKEFVSKKDFNEYELSNVKRYTEEVFREFETINATKIYVEKRESITMYDNKINMVLDTLIVSDTIASVIDLKTGNNDISPVDNEQLYYYGFSVLMRFPKIKKLRLAIFQKLKVKRIEVTRDEVFDFFMNFNDKFKEINTNKLTYSPSEKACHYCAIKDSCKARAKWILGGKR